MPQDNVAALRAWVDANGGTGKCARFLGTSESHLSNILHRRRKPGRDLALKILVCVYSVKLPAGWPV